LIRNGPRSVFRLTRIIEEPWPEVDVFAVDRMLRHLAGTALTVAALVLLDPQVARAEPGVPVPPNGLLTDRGKGDVSDADRDFAVKVRLAGLWEIPAGQMAEEKSQDPRIRAIGKDIATQHVALDKLVRAAAKKLDVTLPDKPNADQQKWLAEMRDAEGEEFDRVYIDRLRAAHGKIFPAIASIRAGTRNDTVRKLAQRTNQFVMTHMTLLESSGIVDFAALPTVPPPAAATGGTANAAQNQAPASSASQLSVSRNPVPAMILIAIASAAVTAFVLRYFMQNSRRPYRRQRPRYFES
jgi:putative membrane protein